MSLSGVNRMSSIAVTRTLRCRSEERSWKVDCQPVAEFPKLPDILFTLCLLSCHCLLWIRYVYQTEGDGWWCPLNQYITCWILLFAFMNTLFYLFLLLRRLACITHYLNVYECLQLFVEGSSFQKKTKMTSYRYQNWGVDRQYHCLCVSP